MPGFVFVRRGRFPTGAAVAGWDLACHCEPVRTLARQSVSPSSVPNRENGLPRARWALAMTGWKTGARHTSTGSGKSWHIVVRAADSRPYGASRQNTSRPGAPCKKDRVFRLPTQAAEGRSTNDSTRQSFGAPVKRSMQQSAKGGFIKGNAPLCPFFWVLFLWVQEKYQRPFVPVEGNETAPMGPPPEPSVSGSGGGRRRSAMSDTCPPGQGEGYGACVDVVTPRLVRGRVAKSRCAKNAAPPPASPVFSSPSLLRSPAHGLRASSYPFNSNLYPTPQTVFRLHWSLTPSSFSRRRLMCTSTVRESPK